MKRRGLKFYQRGRARLANAAAAAAAPRIYHVQYCVLSCSVPTVSVVLLPVGVISANGIQHFLPLLDNAIGYSIPKPMRITACILECVIVTGLFVGLPFMLTPRGTVFEHGICLSLPQWMK